MHKHFKAIGLSHKNTPLEVRESVALSDSSAKLMLQKIREFTSASDVLILSTCNRTEFYYSSEDDESDTILKLLALVNSIENIETYFQYFEKYEYSAAVKHLFDVAIGLDSQVVGDMQITNQVKNAYQYSADEGMAGPFLHRLMHTIFFTNKRVVQETEFRDGAASVSYAAKELVEELASHFQEPNVLIIGLGEIGEDLCRNLANIPDFNVTIANRTHQKAVSLATECNFEVLPFSKAKKKINSADIVISAVNSNRPFLTYDEVKKESILTYKYFIDLSVPRSIDPIIENIKGALVYNIDNIKNKATEALERRLSAIPMVNKILEEAIIDFNDWAKETEVSPIIKKLKKALEDIRQQEMSRYLKNLNQEESKKLDRITKSMMQKVIKLPVLQLKAACKRGEAETLIDVLNDLFDLEREKKSMNK